jgi:hypothetical protein
MEPIIKIFTGKHIDISKLIAVTEPYQNGSSICFEMWFQLMDQPICYGEAYYSFKNPNNPLQQVKDNVDELILLWKQYKNELK